MGGLLHLVQQGGWSERRSGRDIGETGAGGGSGDDGRTDGERAEL